MRPEPDADVVIVGGGPTGLMLAVELRLAGVRPVLLERLPAPSEMAKANGLVGQVVPVMDYRGLYEPLTGAGRRRPGWIGRVIGSRHPAGPRPTPVFMFGGFRLDLRKLPDNPLYALPVPQRRLEQVLQDRALELGAEIRRGHELTGFTQDGDGVTVEVDGPEGSYRLRAHYLVGCDGAHSIVRKTVGIAFPGVTSRDLVSRSAHVVLPRATLGRVTGRLTVPGVGRFWPYAFHRTEHGVFSFASFHQGVHLVNSFEWDAAPVDERVPMSVDELRASMGRVLGQDLPMSPPAGPGPWVLRRVTSRNTRLADRYRAGRVLIAGDAAHVFTGFGGPGLNLGLQDVVNLAWKLAADIAGWAPLGLLDTYHTERYPLAQRVIEQTETQAALLAPGDGVAALREQFAEQLRDEHGRRHIAETVAGTDLPYDLHAGDVPDHPLLGRLGPDLPVLTATGRARVAELMRPARPVLLNLTDDPDLFGAARFWNDRIDMVTGRCARPGAPPALLLRPDGYVAWVGTYDDAGKPLDHGLADALGTWFGSPD